VILLVEGVCGAGKTTLLRALRALVDERASPPLVVLPQRFTYAPIAPAEDAGILDAELNAQILDRLVRRIAALMREHAPGTLFALDTLHITQRVRPGVLSAESFAACDRALAELGCKTLLLEIPDYVLFERTIAGRRHTGFAEYAARFGATEREIADHFSNEQRRLNEVATRESKLPCHREVATAAPRALAAAALRFALDGDGHQPRT